MADGAHDISPTVVIASDKLSAQLVIPPACDRAMLNVQLLTDLIRGRGVEVTDFTTQAVNKLTSSEIPEDQTITIDIAHAQPPVHGVDGYIEWLVGDDAQDNTDAEDAAEEDAFGNESPDNNPEEDKQNVSHYDRSAFVMVEAGDIVANIHRPVTGEDGRDITGNTISAKTGKEVHVKVDESLMLKANCTLVAQQDGVLMREPGKAQIKQRIEIPGYVDFSTGNVDFDGDIVIGKGVRDCFTVCAKGSVEVMGLVEAATIKTGKDLVATGGFAGRERGYAHIGRDLKGKYLDNVQGEVKNDLCIDREVINCELSIDGAI